MVHMCMRIKMGLNTTGFLVFCFSSCLFTVKEIKSTRSKVIVDAIFVCHHKADNSLLMAISVHIEVMFIILNIPTIVNLFVLQCITELE